MNDPKNDDFILTFQHKYCIFASRKFRHGNSVIEITLQTTFTPVLYNPNKGVLGSSLHPKQICDTFY